MQHPYTMAPITGMASDGYRRPINIGSFYVSICTQVGYIVIVFYQLIEKNEINWGFGGNESFELVIDDVTGGAQGNFELR